MDVQASPDVLPELKALWGRFQVRFRRPEGAEPEECRTFAQEAKKSWWLQLWRKSAKRRSGGCGSSRYV
jgi:hypothetical protein